MIRFSARELRNQSEFARASSCLEARPPPPPPLLSAVARTQRRAGRRDGQPHAGLAPCTRRSQSGRKTARACLVLLWIFVHLEEKPPLVLLWCYSCVTPAAIRVLFLRYSCVILALFLRYSGVILVLFWRYSGVILALFRCYSGFILLVIPTAPPPSAERRRDKFKRKRRSGVMVCVSVFVTHQEARGRF